MRADTPEPLPAEPGGVIALDVVVPAHNEERLLPGCLAALRAAAAHAPLIDCRVVVVADGCTDRTAAVATAGGATVIEVGGRCVGAARAAGASEVLSRGTRWVATTDADSLVPTDWLVRLHEHLRAGAQVIVGTVAVMNWSPRAAGLRPVYEDGYGVDAGTTSHRHIHGANLAFTAEAYHAVGGFRASRVDEDVSFVETAEARGLRMVYATDLAVTTSARRYSRVHGGFATYLGRLEATVRPLIPSPSPSPPPAVLPEPV